MTGRYNPQTGGFDLDPNAEARLADTQARRAQQMNPAGQPQQPTMPQGLLGTKFTGDDLMALGQGLLSASNYSRTPISNGAALGAGLGQYQEHKQRQKLNAFKERELGLSEQLYGLKRDELTQKGRERKMYKDVNGRQKWVDTNEYVNEYGKEQAPDNDLVTTLDENGQPIYVKRSEAAGMPAYKAPLVSLDNSSNKPSYLDIPLKVADLGKFRNANGEQPTGIMTPRQLTEQGYTMSSKPSEGEKRGSYVANSLYTASSRVDDVLTTPGFNPSSLKESMRGKSNLTASPEYRKYRSSADEWATNLVFLRSGATARQEEKDKAFENFWPQLNDNDDVRKFKTLFRKEQEINAYKAAMTENRVTNEEAIANIQRLETEIAEIKSDDTDDGWKVKKKN